MYNYMIIMFCEEKGNRKYKIDVYSIQVHYALRNNINMQLKISKSQNHKKNHTRST